MNDRDAQEIVRMIESNWHFDLGEAGRKMWRQEIMMYPPEIATRALGHLARRANYKIVLADFTQTADMLSRNQRDEARRQQEAKAIGEGRRGYATPEWVWIWIWAKCYREVREDRSFPQEADLVDPALVMPTKDFDALREEWQAAGSPKGKMAGLVRTV